MLKNFRKDKLPRVAKKLKAYDVKKKVLSSQKALISLLPFGPAMIVSELSSVRFIK